LVVQVAATAQPAINIHWSNTMTLQEKRDAFKAEFEAGKPPTTSAHP
jgi:hypothetical protein